MSYVITQAFEAQKITMEAGDFAAIARDYAVPAPIFIRDRVLRAETAAEMLTFIKIFFKLAADQGAASMSKNLIGMTPLPNSSHLCMIECKFLDDKGYVLGSNILRQWCRAFDNGMRIELTEFLSMPLGLEPDDIEVMYSEVRRGINPPLAVPGL
jgi:hypothetical protein